MTSLNVPTDALLVLADTETTGVTNTDKIVELAWAELDENLNILRVVRSLIDPQQPICAAASGVHGIVDTDVADAPTIEEFFSLVEPGALQQPLVLMGHNIKFDWRFLKAHVPNMVTMLDTLKLARTYFPDAPNHKLDTLRYYLDLYKGNAHRADEDVKTTVDLLRKISEVSGKTVWELIEESNAPALLKNFPFGKFKGLPIAEASKRLDVREWIQWLLKDSIRSGKPLDPDLHYTLQQALTGGLK